MKQLFTGLPKKKVDSKADQDKYMVRADEMRQRYKEHKGSGVSIIYEPKVNNIISIQIYYLTFGGLCF